MAVNIIDTAFGGIVSSPPSPAATAESRKIPAPPAQQATAGDASGASGAGLLFPITAIQPGVVDGLKASLRDATAKLSSFAFDSQLGSRLRRILGDPGNAGSLGAATQEFVKAVAASAAEPTQAAATVTTAASALTGRLGATTDDVQALRGEVDQQLATAVNAAQSTLQQVAAINDKIALNGAAGSPTGELAAQRDAALAKLSASLDFQSFVRSDGTAAVFTKAGTPLVDGKAATLAFAAAASVAPASVPADGSLSGVTVDGTDIGGQLSAGTIHALLQARDTTLPNLQSQLDTLAQTLQARVNQTSNRSIADADARSAYLGTRRFAAPSTQRLSLSGGDTIVALLGTDGAAKASTSLTALVKQFQQASGLPATGTWSIEQVTSALNGWLNGQLGTRSASYLGFGADGRLSIDLPAATGSRLAFRDQRSTVYQSTLSADPSKPLGLSGSLTFTDNLGNRMSTSPRDVQPGDSLAAITARLNAVGGLKAELTPSGSGMKLTVASSVTADLSLAPDAAGANVVAKLGMAPAADQPAEDVAVNFVAQRSGPSLTSALLPSATNPLGVKGTLALEDQNGATAVNLTVDPAWSLSTLATRIAAAGQGAGIGASVVTVGNQVALKLSAAPGQSIAVPPSATAGDALDFAPPATQLVSGFANFLGLNDIFVADPAQAFDTKAPTGLFTTTATPGTARSLAINPDLQAEPSRLANPELLNRLADLLSGPVAVAAAGGLPRGNYNLAQYADNIATNATAAATAAGQQATYQQALVGSLTGRQASIGDVTMSGSLADLATYQQAYRDSAQVISTMAQLFGSLGVSVH